MRLLGGGGVTKTWKDETLSLCLLGERDGNILVVILMFQNLLEAKLKLHLLILHQYFISWNQMSFYLMYFSSELVLKIFSLGPCFCKTAEVCLSLCHFRF